MSMTNANFPMDAEGNTYHVGVKRGQLANRILTVGDPARATVLSRYLDGADYKEGDKGVSKNLFSFHSHRGFLTITGRFQGVPVSIVAIGMGISMMDFFVRECRAVVDGPMIMIRLGSCGSISNAAVGDMAVPSGAYLVQRNVNHFVDPEEIGGGAADPNPYTFSRVFMADKEITATLAGKLEKHLGKDHVHQGINATSDSFYSSQGRQDLNFWDDNQTLFEDLVSHNPETSTLEMETFTLYHLAKTSTPAPLLNKTADTKNSIRAGACMMVFAQRSTNAFISKEQVAFAEPLAGRAVLEALVEIGLGDEKDLHPSAGSVWAK